MDRLNNAGNMDMALQAGFSPQEALSLLTICYSINCNKTGVKPGKDIGPVNLPSPPASGGLSLGTCA